MSTAHCNGGRRGGMIILDARHPLDLIDPLARRGRISMNTDAFELDARHPQYLIDTLARRGRISMATDPLELDARHPEYLIDTLARRGRTSMTTDPFKLDVRHPQYLIDPLALTGYNGYSDFAVPVHIHVDWLEIDHTHIFKANLPGLKKEDVKVEVDGGVMHITGECKKDEVDKNDKWHCLERAHGTASRCFHLPENVMLDEVKANMTNGVLTLTVPKTAENKSEVVPIEISEN